jgi:hypothetical protein
LHKNITCTVPAIIGDIKLNITEADGKTKVNLEYPESAELVLHLPDNADVTVNGKSVETAEKILVI